MWAYLYRRIRTKLSNEKKEEEILEDVKRGSLKKIFFQTDFEARFYFFRTLLIFRSSIYLNLLERWSTRRIFIFE